MIRSHFRDQGLSEKTIQRLFQSGNDILIGLTEESTAIQYGKSLARLEKLLQLALSGSEKDIPNAIKIVELQLKYAPTAIGKGSHDASPHSEYPGRAALTKRLAELAGND